MTFKMTAVGSAIALASLAGASAAQDTSTTWHADLASLNSEAAGSEAGGTATLTVSGDTLTIKIDATGTAPDIMHLQHFHGFTEGDRTSACPGADADTNGDGIIDLIETEPGAGTTMVPFHDDPASLEIVADTYPKADDEGSYSYEQTIALPALEEAVAKKFPRQKLDFGRRVIFLHGVPEDTDLPDTVQSLGDIPAQITLPIACGTIDRSKG